MHLKRMICVGAAVMGIAATASVASASAAITEAGSSLVYPLVYKWSTVYTTTKVSPAAGGSSAGISDISASSPSVNIGASDAPMTSSQYSSDSHNAVEIPWALSATDVVYNIPGLHAGLKLSATIVAEIYTGKITRWSSPAILKLNKDYSKALKKAPKITPVFRSDGSGDSFVFQNFMFKGAPKVWPRIRRSVDRLPRHRRTGRERQLRRRRRGLQERRRHRLRLGLLRAEPARHLPGFARECRGRIRAGRRCHDRRGCQVQLVDPGTGLGVHLCRWR